jgi:hypothetical protein
MKAKPYWQCLDGLCGALDCPRCSPQCFRGGVFIKDLEDQQDKTGSDMDAFLGKRPTSEFKENE